MIISIIMAVEYKKFIGLKSIFYFCSLPLRVDSYRGCTIGCKYCFSRSINNRKNEFNKVISADPNKLERYFLKQNEKKNRGIIQQCIDYKIPLHFGCVSDPFQIAEIKHKTTLEMLKVIRTYNYPIVLCTKSDLILKEQYVKLLEKVPLVVQISFSTLNDKLAKKLEPNAPSPSERIEVLKALSEKGIYTVARFQPFLYPIESIDANAYKKVSESGVKHIVLEHLRIPTNSKLEHREKLWNVLKVNMLDEFKRLGLKYSRVNYELSSKVKYQNIITARKNTHKYGMTFGSGDNDFHHFSDNPCCCGIPNNEHFSNIYKGHLGISAYKSIRNKKFNCANINNEWQPSGSIKENINSDCRISGINDTISLLKHKVANPRSSNSPLGFYGISLDKKGKYIVDGTIWENGDSNEYI